MPKRKEKIAAAEHKWARKIYEQLSWKFVEHPDDPSHEVLAEDCKKQSDQIHRELRGLNSQKRVFVNTDERQAFESLHSQASATAKQADALLKQGDLHTAESLIDDCKAMLNAFSSIIDQGQETADEIYGLRSKVLDTKSKISALGKAQAQITSQKARDELLSLRAVADEWTGQAEFFTRAGKKQESRSAVQAQSTAYENLVKFISENAAGQSYAAAKPEAQSQHYAQNSRPTENSTKPQPPVAEMQQSTKNDLLRGELKQTRIQVAQCLNRSAEIQDQNLIDEFATLRMLAIEYGKEVDACLNAQKTRDAERNLSELKGLKQNLERCLRDAAYNNQQREIAARQVEEQRLATQREAERRAEERRLAEQREAQRRAQEERRIAAQQAEYERLRAEQQAASKKKEQVATYQRTLGEAQNWLSDMEARASSIRNTAKQDEFATYRILAKDFMSQIQASLNANQPQNAEHKLIELGRLLNSAQEIMNGSQQQKQQAQPTAKKQRAAPQQPQEPKKERIAYKKKAKGIRNNVDAREKPSGPNPNFYCEVQDGMFCLKHSMNACLGFGAISEKDMEEGLLQTGMQGFKGQSETQLFSEVKNYMPGLTLQSMRQQLAKNPDAFYRKAAKAQQDMLFGGMPAADFIRHNGSEPLMGIAIMKHKQKELGLPEFKDEWLKKPKTEADIQANADKVKDIAETGADRLILGAGGHFIALRKNQEGDWFEVDSQQPAAKRVDLDQYIKEKSRRHRGEALAVLHFGEEVSFEKQKSRASA